MEEGIVFLTLQHLGGDLIEVKLAVIIVVTMAMVVAIIMVIMVCLVSFKEE